MKKVMDVELNVIGKAFVNEEVGLEENLIEIADRAREILIDARIFEEIDREEVTVERLDLDDLEEVDEEIDEEEEE